MLHRGVRRGVPAAVVLALAGVVLAGCRSEPDPIEVGETTAGEPEEIRSEINVFDVDAPEEVPPPEAELFAGGWEEAAAWIAREAEAGRPTLVNIFASWCEPCAREMPMLVEASQRHTDVAFLGIDHLDPIDAGRDFVEEHEIPFATIHDLGGDVAVGVGSRGMPTTVVFDRDGFLAGRVIGEISASTLDELLDDVR